MEQTKNSGPIRAVAFLFIAVSLIAFAGLAASGISFDENSPSPEQNTAEETPKQIDVNDSVDEPVVPEPEKHTHLLTGTVYEGELIDECPTAFILDAESGLYGLSGADILIEFPTDTSSRFLAVFPNPEKQEKIGSVAPFRLYFSPFASLFDDNFYCFGYDDGIEYAAETPISCKDLEKSPGSIYLESDGKVCTSGKRLNLTENRFETENLPFAFSNEPLSGQTARVALLCYAEDATRAFSYSDEDKLYRMASEKGEEKDGFSGEELSFTNVIVLFADTVTYTTESSQETVIQYTGGKGICLSQGFSQNFLWKLDEAGKPIFTDDEGNKITVSPGKTYISVFPSSSKYFTYFG